MARNRKPTIYPELVKPGDWVIEEWRPDGTGAPCPCTDNEGRRMYVPSGSSKFAKEVRFHELLHVRYSPPGCPEVEGVTGASLLAAEDCRVNLLGARIRDHDTLGTTPMPDPFALLMSQTERGMARLAAACLGYASSEDWFDHLEEGFSALRENEGLPDWLQRHAHVLRRAIRTVRNNAIDALTDDGGIEIEETTFDETINLARWTDEIFWVGPLPRARRIPEMRARVGALEGGGEGKGGTGGMEAGARCALRCHR